MAAKNRVKKNRSTDVNIIVYDIELHNNNIIRFVWNITHDITTNNRKTGKAYLLLQPSSLYNIQYEIVIRSRPSWLWAVGGHIRNYYITILLYDFYRYTIITNYIIVIRIKNPCPIHIHILIFILLYILL